MGDTQHCTTLRDGHYVPTFPNARYLLLEREYRRWNPSLPGYRELNTNIGVFERSVLPVMAAGLVDLITGPHLVSTSLAIESAPGHTVGHSVLLHKPNYRSHQEVKLL